MKILFVCLGNICRSPMAEGIFEHKAKALGVDVTFDSAGTGDWHAGEAPDKRAQETAKKNGVDISGLRARQFIEADFDRFDRIYVMDRTNQENVLQLASSSDEKDKVRLMLNETYPDENRSVPDPYFGGDDGFNQVFAMLDRAAGKVLTELKQ